MKKVFYTIMLSLGFVGLSAENAKPVLLGDVLRVIQEDVNQGNAKEEENKVEENIVIPAENGQEVVVVKKNVFKKAVNWLVNHKGLTIAVASSVVIAAALYLTKDMQYGLMGQGTKELANKALDTTKDGAGFIWEKSKDGANWVKNNSVNGAKGIANQSKRAYNSTATFVSNNKKVTAISSVVLISTAIIVWDLLRDKDSSFLKKGTKNVKETAFELYKKIKNDNTKSLLPSFLE